MIFDFTPIEWGLLGFAGFLFLLGICYIIEDERRKRNAERNQ